MKKTAAPTRRVTRVETLCKPKPPTIREFLNDEFFGLGDQLKDMTTVGEAISELKEEIERLTDAADWLETIDATVGLDE